MNSFLQLPSENQVSMKSGALVVLLSCCAAAGCRARRGPPPPRRGSRPRGRRRAPKTSTKASQASREAEGTRGARRRGRGHSGRASYRVAPGTGRRFRARASGASVPERSSRSGGGRTCGAAPEACPARPARRSTQALGQDSLISGL